MCALLQWYILKVPSSFKDVSFLHESKTTNSFMSNLKPREINKSTKL